MCSCGNFLSVTLLDHGLVLLTRNDVTTGDKLDANGSMDKNNSELLDRGDANQNLKAKDIEAMREAGMGGEAIVEALLANSETYESKTHFAQVPLAANQLHHSELLAIKYLADPVQPVDRARASVQICSSI